MKTVGCAFFLVCMASVVHAEPPMPPPPGEDDALAAPFSDDELREAEQRYAREPHVDEVVREALSAAPRSRAAELAARARAAGWVPRLDLRARRGTTVDLSTPQSLNTDTVRVSSNAGITVEAALIFELDRAVFRHEEVALARQSEAEQEKRSRIVREVIALYFERRRLQLLRDLRADPSLRHRIRLAEIEALLDAFTNGAFRRMIARRWTTAADTPASGSHSQPKSK